ncbi:acetate--CoA ligase family protein [Rhodopila sp.]|uniref:acetate--CoA ligase family protein n=1 Tax=Rhodopila sp. TaxID=2480087 RepID=UPI003D0B184A
MTSHKLHSFFWPESIAVLGASPDLHRIRGRLFRQLRDNGYPGRVLPINPSYQELDGLRCYPSICAVEGSIDLALIAIPAAGVAAAVDECARAGAKNVLIISSGFAEEGGAAGDMQADLLAVTKRTGIRACGPNCEGYYNALGRVATTFSPTVETKEQDDRTLVSQRRVGVIAQSGGIGFALFNRGAAAGLGFSYVISTGNEADLTMADFLDYMVEDPQTHAVMLFCEAVRDGPGFVAALEKARALGKPVIAIKVGRSDAGKRASASHTASLSGSHTAYHAIFERYGVIEAEDADEAVAIAGVVLTCPLPTGRRAGIITVSGGGGAWMADTLSAHGLLVPNLSAASQAALRPLMPSYGASGNPVDVTAQGSNTGPAMMTVMEHLARSDEIDIMVLVTSLASETRASLDADRIRAVADRCGKPMTVWSYTLPSAFGRSAAAGCGLFVHSDLRNVGVAMGKLASYAEALRRPLPDPFTPVSGRLYPGLPPVVPEYLAKQVLAAWLPDTPEQLAGSPEEAADAADRLGFPVALKLQSPDLPHKTEVGGVKLALADRAAVAGAYTNMLTNVGHRAPGAKIDGVLVQRMAPRGYELVIGMVNDPTFGPIMMLGFGGTTVELFGDVVHAPAPLDEAEATRLILSLKAARLLTGFRGAEPIDLAPLAALVAALSRAALTLTDQVREFELNPVILHADGSGLTVADALLLMKQ